MKKKIFGAAVVVAIAVGAMINVNLNKVSNKGDLALANVEALADSEASTGGYQSMMIVDQGTSSGCRNGYFCSIQKFDVYCYGVGNISCQSGSYEVATSTGTRCYDV